MRRGVLLVVVSALVIAGLLLGACAAPAPSAPAAPSSPAAPAAPAAPKTLKLAHNIAFGWPLGLDCQKMVDIDVAKINKAGGLDVGGQKYMIEMVWDDNKMDLAVAKTVGQKEIFQDGVKFILSDPWAPPLFPIVEENKIVFIPSVYDLSVFDPKWNWIWNTGAALSFYPACIPYMAKHYPNLKTMVGGYPDRIDGRLAGEQHEKFAMNAGLKVLGQQYYPPAATDLSAMGTKIKQLNPDLLVAYGGGPPGDATVLKAAYAAGWRGQTLCPATAPAAVMMAIVGPEAAEGMLGIGWPSEFEPATTEMAKVWKADYIAKFGKWDDPETVIALPYYCLKAALQKAGSIDPAKVKAVLDTEFRWDTPMGTSARVSMESFKNPKAVNHTVGNLPVKQIVKGQVKQIGTIPIEEAIQLHDLMWGN